MSEAAKSLTSSLSPPQSAPQTFGRYVLHAQIARGGMASIYIARLIGAEGFSRLVAAKRLHPQFTEDPDFVTMFHDEARIASKIHHPNVVPVLDVVLSGQEVIIVQEYVHGVPLDKLFKSALLSEDTPIPVNIVVAIISGVLSGLHAAHETKDEMDEPLHIVHRDVSPENVIVSMDGLPRLLDFGIAKASSSAHVTREGFFKGKIAYMAPEQLRAEDVTRSADIYATGVLLWELLAHRRLHTGRGEAELFSAVLSGAIPSLTSALESTRSWIADQRWEQLTRLEPIVSRALSTHPSARFESAADMLSAILATCPPASSTEVARWVKTVGADYLERRQMVLASSEESWRSHSKISAADPSSFPPESIIKLIAHRDAPASPPPDSVSPLYPVDSTALSALESPGLRTTMRRAGIVPWIVAAGLLWVVGILLGVLAVRNHAPEPVVAAPPPPIPTVAEVAPALTGPITVTPAPDPSPPVASPSAKSSHMAIMAAPPRWSPPKAPAPPATHASAPPPTAHAAPQAPQPSAAPTPSNAPSPKADCDPPFYFEGSKKLFKPNCL